MARVRETWVSSTLATELVSLAAADAVLDVWERRDVAGHITRIGTRMMEALEKTIRGGEPRLLGIPEMWFLRFEDPGLETPVPARLRRARSAPQARRRTIFPRWPTRSAT